MTRRFRFRLALVALFGLLVRVAYIAVSRQRVQGDGSYYHAIAGVLADGKGFVQPQAYLSSGQMIPWAPHPPLWPLLLALPARIGLRTYSEQQLTAALVGTATVVVIGFAGRRLVDARVGLIAAAVAAVYPNFFLYERDLLAETLAIFLVTLVLLLAFRFNDRPGTRRAAALGATCGLLALTRSEQVLLIVLLVVPLVLLVRGVRWQQRVTWLAVSVIVAVAVIAPWTAYNASRFKDPVLLSHELGPTLVEANCDAVYSGPDLGYRSGPCLQTSPSRRIPPGGDGSTRDAATRHVAIDYIRAHLGRLPLVVLAREGRVGGVPADPAGGLRSRPRNAPTGHGPGFRRLLVALDRRDPGRDPPAPPRRSRFSAHGTDSHRDDRDRTDVRVRALSRAGRRIHRVARGGGDRERYADRPGTRTPLACGLPGGGNGWRNSSAAFS